MVKPQFGDKYLISKIKEERNKAKRSKFIYNVHVDSDFEIEIYANDKEDAEDMLPDYIHDELMNFGMFNVDVNLIKVEESNEKNEVYEPHKDNLKLF